MADKTAIGWTATIVRRGDDVGDWQVVPGATWNTHYGCTKIRIECAHCYIDRTPPYRMAGMRFERGHIPIKLLPGRLTKPLEWSRGRRIFVNSLSDTFHPDVPDDYIVRIYAVMALAMQHTFLVLTKRPDRMRALTCDMGFIADVFQAAAGMAPERFDPTATSRWPLPNVWAGATAGNRPSLDAVADDLLGTQAAVRWLSVEPLLGPMSNLEQYVIRSRPVTDDLRDAPDGAVVYGMERVGGQWERQVGIDWVVTGGESGTPKASLATRPLVERCACDLAKFWDCACDVRPGKTFSARSTHCRCHGTGWRPRHTALAWTREIRDLCADNGVAFLHKQWGGDRSKSGGRLLDGMIHHEYPDGTGLTIPWADAPVGLRAA